MTMFLTYRKNIETPSTNPILRMKLIILMVSMETIIQGIERVRRSLWGDDVFRLLCKREVVLRCCFCVLMVYKLFFGILYCGYGIHLVLCITDDVM